MQGYRSGRPGPCALIIPEWVVAIRQHLQPHSQCSTIVTHSFTAGNRGLITPISKALLHLGFPGQAALDLFLHHSDCFL